MKKIIFISIMLLLIPVTLFADIYDVNKTWNGDSNMCWAASAANILAYEGWTTSSLLDSQAIFNDFKANWANQPGDPASAIAWYERKYFATSNPYSTMEISYSTSNSMNAIDSYLAKGYGVSAYVMRLAGGAHIVTIWGDTYVDGVRKLIITDSDDGKSGTALWPVYWNAEGGYWNFNMYLGLAYLGEIVGLDPYHGLGEIPPPIVNPIVIPDPSPTNVPEPGTLTLMLLGLAGITIGIRLYG